MKKMLFVLLAASFFGTFVSAQEYFDCIVFVLDASGSMSDPMTTLVNGRKVYVKYESGPQKGRNVQRIDAAKMVLERTFDEIPDSTHVGVLVFSGSGIRDPWIHPLGPKDHQRFKSELARLSPSGGTPLGTFMKEGADKLMDRRKAQFNNGTYGLIVITDGEANGEPHWYVNSKLAREKGYMSYVEEIMSRGIRLTAIGVSMDSEHTLAKEVSYRSADDPESFLRAMKESVSEVSITSAVQTFEGSGFDGDISGIPVEVASAIIAGISQVQNHPIGTKPLQVSAQESYSGPVSPSGAPSSPSQSLKLIPLLMIVLLVGVFVICILNIC
jgi:hypothetical protein